MAEFDAFAATYEQSLDASIGITGESFDYFAKYKAAYIARKVAPKGPAKILDYGCGVGLLSNHLRALMPEKRIDGYDPSEESILRIGPELQLQGTFTAEECLIGTDYDVIVVANVLHHVFPRERRELIQKVTSRLQAGGKLVIFEHNPLNPLTRRAVSQCVFDGDAVLLPQRETRGYFPSREFHVRRDYVVFFPRLLSWLRRLEPLLAWCPAGAQYAVTATKLA
jgi:2-polyprenyl-3-methyl-5-hydroxy-6-metoxy-1,4-benzoquinol methylase